MIVAEIPVVVNHVVIALAGKGPQRGRSPFAYVVVVGTPHLHVVICMGTVALENDHFVAVVAVVIVVDVVVMVILVICVKEVCAAWLAIGTSVGRDRSCLATIVFTVVGVVVVVMLVFLSLLWLFVAFPCCLS